jgi:phospholipid-transporting ATPase
MATKVLSEEEYRTFEKKYNDLGNSENRAAELTILTDALERDLFLVGATAVEDKL